jgi:hypothetical protein
VLQRLIAAVLGALGLLAIGLGVASSTVWRGDDILVATASPDAHLVVGDPGVLELAGDPVTVTVHAADDAPVVIAVGRDTDIAGWVGTDAHAQVTGLTGWHVLRTETVAAEPAPTPAEPTPAEPAATDPAATDPSASATSEATAGATPAVADPTGSDLWVAQATGNGTATLTWDAQPGRWSLVVASLGESSPVIELAWPRTVTTPWLWPGVVGGALLLLTGLGLGARLWIRARRGLTGPEWHPVHTGAMPTVGIAGAGPASVDTTETMVLTRRQMREAQAAITPAVRRRGRGTPDSAPTGSLPLPVPAAGREAPTEPDAWAGSTPVPVATGLAPSDVRPAARSDAGPAARDDAGPAARDDAGPAATAPPEDRTQADDPRAHAQDSSHAGPTSMYGSHALPGQASGVPAPSRPASTHSHAAPPTPVAALPSYFLRPNAPAAARTAPAAPVAPGGWFPGGPAAEPPASRPAAAAGPAGPGSATAGGGPDQPFEPRPTWTGAKPGAAVEPSDEPPSARADAWRRAWGFPGHDGGGADDAAGATDEGTHR